MTGPQEENDGAQQYGRVEKKRTKNILEVRIAEGP